MSRSDTASGSSVILHVTADPAHGAEFAREMSERPGFEVISVASVDAALETLHDSPGIACIVSDHDLPDVDGVTFLEMVRVQHPDLPFILFTGQGSERTASRAINARVTDYLIKDQFPDQWTHLASLIVRAIEFHRLQVTRGDSGTRVKTILETCVDAIAIVHDGSFRYANENAVDLFGADSCEALGDSTPMDLIDPESREVTARTLAAVQAGERNVDRLEQNVVGLDGLVTPVELTASAIDWETDPAILLIFHDISGRRRRARILERENERLKTVTEVLSHDLRNPLVTAQGRLELAKSECTSEELEQLGEMFERMISIVEDTSTLARLGDPLTETEPVVLTDLLTHCWRMVGTTDATLEILDEMTVRGDPDQLRHLFENLFANAVEHGATSDRRPLDTDTPVENGGSAVTVRIGRAGEHTVYVEDDGPGIPAEERERVLEPRYSSVGGGHGLGLAIVTWVAEAHGWEVAITDGRDGGTRVEITGIEFLRDRFRRSSTEP